jgi:hypothetical protein
MAARVLENCDSWEIAFLSSAGRVASELAVGADAVLALAGARA